MPQTVSQFCGPDLLTRLTAVPLGRQQGHHLLSNTIAHYTEKFWYQRKKMFQCCQCICFLHYIGHLKERFVFLNKVLSYRYLLNQFFVKLFAQSNCCSAHFKTGTCWIQAKTHCCTHLLAAPILCFIRWENRIHLNHIVLVRVLQDILRCTKLQGNVLAGVLSRSVGLF